jgi:NIPSNAP protein
MRLSHWCAALLIMPSGLRAAPNGPPAEAAPAPARTRAVEFRAYNLKPGGREEFHRLVTEVCLPMLRRQGIDVVAFGPSAQDETSYYLVRAFADLADRRRQEDAFYGSEEWRQGPRDRILALIDSYGTAVLELDETVVQGLRRRAR